LVLILTDDEAMQVLRMGKAIDVVREAFRKLGEGSVEMPLRVQMRYPKTDGIVRIMPASIDGRGELGVKMLLGNPASRKPDLTYFSVLLFAPDDGHLLAMIGARRLTQLRTGAASAVATDYLARKDVSTVGIFGCGAQAWGQLEGLAEVRDVKNVKVFDVDTGRSRDFAERARKELGVTVSEFTSPSMVVKGSDVVVTATTSTTPVFNGDDLEEGTHVNAIGSNAPVRQEIDVKTLSRSKIVVDSLEQVRKEAGDFVVPMESGQFDIGKVYAELCDLVTGRKKGREVDSEVTLFKSVGVAIEDIAVASAVYQEATQRGLGREIAI
jgi:alanine dehydrogenase